MASQEKFGRMKQLVDSGKEKGYVLYDEVNDLLPDEMTGTPELEDLLADIDSAGIEILEEPRADKIEDGEDFAETDLSAEFVDKLS